MLGSQKLTVRGEASEPTCSSTCLFVTSSEGNAVGPESKGNEPWRVLGHRSASQTLTMELTLKIKQ